MPKYGPAASRRFLTYSLVLILFLGGGLIANGFYMAGQTRAWVQHTYVALGLIKDLNAAVLGAENRQRGYLLTGNAVPLMSYGASSAHIFMLESQLANLTIDNAAQQERLRQLDSLLVEKGNELEQTVQLRRFGGFDAAAAVARTNAGVKLTDRIEDLLTAASENEQTLLARRLAEADHSRLWVRISVLVAMVTGALTMLRLLQAANMTATTDFLTGLLSRDRVMEVLSDWRGSPRRSKAALLLIDVDRFRSVNQVFDPRVADEVLCQIGRRLTHCAGGHRVGRIGGDDFAICCFGIDLDVAEALGATLVAAMAMPFQTAGRSLHLTASIGVVHSDGEADIDLRQSADDALHVAKSRGGNQSIRFQLPMYASRRSEADLEEQLHLALGRHDELTLAYQPVVRLSDGVMIAIEALARWTHPRLGIIPPDRFIALAESRAMIMPLGLKLMGIAIRQAASWHARFPQGCPVMNLNVSPFQLKDGDFLADLMGLLRIDALRPQDFCLEVTEGAFADLTARQVLEAARGLGFKISMDDFGIGYSSLSQLPRLPLSSVKLDRSFVSYAAVNTGDAAMLGPVVQLAHALGLTVIAEGVETRDQLDLVTRCGCDAVQGYFLAKPLPPHLLETWLGAGTARGGRLLEAALVG